MTPKSFGQSLLFWTFGCIVLVTSFLAFSFMFQHMDAQTRVDVVGQTDFPTRAFGKFFLHLSGAPARPGPCPASSDALIAMDAQGYLYFCNFLPGAPEVHIWRRTREPLAESW